MTVDDIEFLNGINMRIADTAPLSLGGFARRRRVSCDYRNDFMIFAHATVSHFAT
jgi:hypothetical protein